MTIADLRRLIRRRPEDTPVIVVITLDDGTQRTGRIEVARVEDEDLVHEKYNLELDGPALVMTGDEIH